MGNKRGFNLIEVMIALGVMSVGGYFLLSMLKTSSIGQKTLLAQDEARILTDNMANMLNNPDACQYTLGDGAPVETPAVPALTPAVNAIPDGTYTGTPPTPNTNNVFPISKIYDAKMNVQFQVTSPPTKYGSKGIQLKAIYVGGTGSDKPGPRWYSPDGVTGTAAVEVDWEQTGGAGNSMGPQILKRFFMVNVIHINNHMIKTCTSKLGGGGGPGTGVANYLAYWDTDTSIKDSNVYQAAVTKNIGIGTASPTSPLHVNGNTQVTGNVLASGRAIVTVPHASGASVGVSGLANASAMTNAALSFTKTSAATTVWIMYSSSSLFANCGISAPCSCVEEVLVNGASCSPVPAVASVNGFTNTYDSGPVTISAFCTGLPASTIAISVRATAAGDGYCMGGTWSLAAQEIN